MILINKLKENFDACATRQPGAGGVVAAVLLAVFAVGTPLVAAAEQTTAPAIQEDPGLKLPDDLAAGAGKSDTGTEGPTPKFEIEEKRVGGRLERVTVKRSNGIDEVYENKEIDSMFSKEDNELGEVQNVRRWTLGTW